ncbi:MAG TPA: sodium-translocating pyrophosphatase [Caldisericia bacterium]|nr:sodium-translocating pyrophosphatase [Caldisericia bacterium]HXK51521.1 sodium-translocating pyrophosphatase [Caldisericia bacterium]
MISVWIAFLMSILGFFIVLHFVQSILHYSAEKSIQEIGLIIRRGAFAYLRRQYKILAPFVVGFTVLILFLFSFEFAILFLTGSLFSIASGFIGMSVSTIANYKTTAAAKKNIQSALQVSFTGGSIMGIATCSFGILGLSISFLLAQYYTQLAPIDILLGYSLGASLVALFARIGGGIFTKAADIGADIVGKTEANIPEDDPRNPAVIADNVGDNVGDVAGMGADLFESYIGAAYGCFALIALFHQGNMEYISFIFTLLSIGFFSSIVVIFVARQISMKDNINPNFIIKNIGVFSSLLAIVLTFFASYFLLQNLFFFYAVTVGILCGSIIGFITDYYTASKPIRIIASASEAGTASNILSGFSYGMQSTFLTITTIVIAIFISYALMNVFGIALAGLGMLITVAATISVDAYGPISDNAGGIAEMTHQPEYVRQSTDQLDSIGNTTAAIGKGFSIGSAALTALTLFNTFTHLDSVQSLHISFALDNPQVIIGLFIGGMLPFLFSALTINSVTQAATPMVEEVRRQFKEKPGLLKGLSEPDYEKCIDISTTGAIKGMIVPSLLGVVFPFILYITIGIESVIGLLAGALICGVTMAVFMANSGGAWDNAKKYIEAGHHGGKGSMAHIASVTGDTVGDPLKDTAGPSLNILIKLISIITLTFIPLFL